MGKKIAWTAMVTFMSAATASLTAHLAARLWVKITGEEPPVAPGWAKLLLAVPAKKAVDAAAG